MNDEMKQEQQQQPGATQEAGGAGAGESNGNTPPESGGDSLSAVELSSSNPGLPSNSGLSSTENIDSSSKVDAKSIDAPAADYANGLKCSWHGKAAADMPRDELIAFIGMLDDYATRLAKAAQGAGSDSQTEQLTAAHPIHTVLAELESEIERPGAILKARVKSLINAARALF
ncbi:hypothetical protein [Burkholderia gladioli]|uniref:hypothetical protein n=1 Tax=Burkholderia gladioli TaxID=28095 RepID=UPI00163FA827|nr:hypothetical protein [Burkholderia gladioli]